MTFECSEGDPTATSSRVGTKRSVFKSGEKVLKQAKAAGTLPARKPKGPADLYRRTLYLGPRLTITSSRRSLAGLAWVPLCDSNYEPSPIGQFCMIRISATENPLSRAASWERTIWSNRRIKSVT